MKLNKPLKIIIGLLTAWVVIAPFLYIAIWFTFVFGMASFENQARVNPNLFPAFTAAFFIPFILIMCSSIVQLGLQAFYIVHIILNKTGGDVIRAVLGVGMFILAIIAMPVYYFVFILPENPPQWALAASPSQPVGSPPVAPPPNMPNQ